MRNYGVDGAMPHPLEAARWLACSTGHAHIQIHSDGLTTLVPADRSLARAGRVFGAHTSGGSR